MPGRARDCSLVDGQLGYQRVVDPLLAQRGLDAVVRAQHHGRNTGG